MRSVMRQRMPAAKGKSLYAMIPAREALLWAIVFSLATNALLLVLPQLAEEQAERRAHVPIMGAAEATNVPGMETADRERMVLAWAERGALRRRARHG